MTARISRRAMLAGFAASAGAALLAACGGETAATTAPAVATRGVTTAPPANATAAPAATTGAAAATTGSTIAGATTAPATSGSAAAGAVRLSGTVKVGTKDFTEEFIVGQMYKLLLEQAGAKVDYKQNLGGTPICQAAMEKGDIDLYPEYTGTGLVTILKLPANSDPKMVFDTVSREYKTKYNFVWLDAAPMNNTQALAMTMAASTKFGVTSISQLAAKAGELTMVGPAEFQEREDGLPGIQKAYGMFKLKSYRAVAAALKYQALREGQADVAVAYGTDGEIAADKLIVLQDDKKLFPVYQIAPVVRQQALDATPGIRQVLNTVAPLLTDDVMRTLNFQVDGMKQEPADVAKTFLTMRGLLK